MTLQVEIPQDFHLHSHQTWHCRRLSKLRLLHQVNLPVYIYPIFLSQTQPQCSRNPSKILKWTFPLSLLDCLMHLNPHSSKWIHWRCFSRLLLLPIPLTYLITIITFCILMKSCSIKSLASLSTTPFNPLLWPISHLIPTVFQHSYQNPFRHKGLPQFQIPPTGTLQVTYPQPFHINFSQIPHIRRLYQIHPLLPVNIKVLRTQAIQSHPKGFHICHPNNIHMIRLSLILNYPQFCFCLQPRVWYPEILHQICLVYCHPISFWINQRITLSRPFLFKVTNPSNLKGDTW